MKNLALFIMRVTVGGLVAGHGAQKLFGVFNGPGLKGTSGFMEALGIKPGGFWGPIAALGEFSGGVLTALGFLHPMGPQNIAATMTVAARRAHWTKGLWNSNGGMEFPLTNLAVAVALMMTGPGRFSLDHVFGIRLPKWMVALSWINFVGFTVAALFKPEAVQTVLDRVTGSAPAYTGPADSEDHPADLEVERRPRAAESTEVKERAGI